MRAFRLACCVVFLVVMACTPKSNTSDTPQDASSAVPTDAGHLQDAAVPDASHMDASISDAATPADAAIPDATVTHPDAAIPDAALPDSAQPDAAVPDAGDPRVGCPTNATIPAWVTRQGDHWTATCGTTALQVTALMDGVLHVRATGALPVVQRPSWAVGTVVPSTVTAGSRGADFALCSPEVSMVVDAQCHWVVRDANDVTILETGSAGGFSEDTTSGSRTVRLNATTGDHYYGLGERTGTTLDKRGHVYTFRNTDAYVDAFGGYPPDADPLYQSIPLLLTWSAGRVSGLFVDNTYRMELDLAAAEPTVQRWTASGGAMDLYVMGGPSFARVLQQYTGLTGRIPLPPRWSLGYHQSRWGYSPLSRVEDVMHQFRTRNIPADGIWLDIQHMDGFRSFTFDAATFANPAGLMATAEGLGFKAVTIVDPGIKVDPAWDVYQQGVAGEHFLQDADGGVYVGQVWPGAAVFPDFTRESTRLWWHTLVERNTQLGVRGLWIDMNEPSNMLAGAGGTVPDSLVVDGDGVRSTMAEAHNVYAHQMARATFDGLAQAAPARRPFVLTRAGYAGIQTHAAVWTGDAPSTWETLGVTLPMMLNLGLSGVPFVGSDVGGYSGHATPELFARWMELGSISPFFRGHVTNGVNDQEPWAFGVEVEYISKVSIGDRYQLLPYLYSLFAQSTQTGAPILRPLVYDFQDDPDATTISDEAMVGPFLLAAPVLQSGVMSRVVSLPAGRWFEYHSGAIVDGPATVDTAVTLEALPLYVREGAIIPRVPVAQFSDAQPAAPLTLDVYPGATPTAFSFYEDAGDGVDHLSGVYRWVTYALAHNAMGATLSALPASGSYTPPGRTLRVRVRRVEQAPMGVFLDGAAVAPLSSESAFLTATSGYWFDQEDRSVWVALEDVAPFSLAVHYDPTVTDLAPLVSVPVQVRVPAGTPTTAPISIATSADGWATHHALNWDPGMTSASGVVQVPRGQWFFYKYTRGGWPTVEKWAGCMEATNRYAFGAAHPGKQDAVDTWADWCP